MAVSPELRDYILDLLNGLGGVTARSMFGGIGLYRDGVMFGLTTRNDVLYFRTGDGNRGQYEAAGMVPSFSSRTAA
jgi:DNA transformation protein